MKNVVAVGFLARRLLKKWIRYLIFCKDHFMPNNVFNKPISEIEICFVHTPMASTVVDNRDKFWKHFDTRYYAAHENSKPGDSSIWELPHWMTWLGGVLKANDSCSHSSIVSTFACIRKISDLY